jgi:hypothetical protein
MQCVNIACIGLPIKKFYWFSCPYGRWALSACRGRPFSTIGISLPAEKKDDETLMDGQNRTQALTPGKALLMIAKISC